MTLVFLKHCCFSTNQNAIREVLTVFSRLPSWRWLQANPPLQTFLLQPPLSCCLISNQSKNQSIFNPILIAWRTTALMSMSSNEKWFSFSVWTALLWIVSNHTASLDTIFVQIYMDLPTGVSKNRIFFQK